MNFLAIIKRTFSVSLFLGIAFISFSSETNAQDRERVVRTNKENSPRQTTQIPASPNSNRRTLTNEIIVRERETPQSLVRKTSQSTPTKSRTSNVKKKKAVRRNAYSATTQSMMLNSINKKIGIRYRMGTQGPNLYDCSGFVWKVFEDSGISFTRTSAREFWRTFEPVTGDDRFEFGTLVFFNRLGHVGIVADEEGFYHASSSRGVTYSKFSGYWSKRIVGYRRVPANNYGWDEVEVDDDYDNDER